MKLRTEVIALGTAGHPGPRLVGYPRDVGPRDVGAIKDIQRLAPMAQPGRSDCPAASGPVRYHEYSNPGIRN